MNVCLAQLAALQSAMRERTVGLTAADSRPLFHTRSADGRPLVRVSPIVPITCPATLSPPLMKTSSCGRSSTSALAPFRTICRAPLACPWSINSSVFDRKMGVPRSAEGRSSMLPATTAHPPTVADPKALRRTDLLSHGSRRRPTAIQILRSPEKSASFARVICGSLRCHRKC